MTDVCSTCGRPLLWVSGQLRCVYAHCPGPNDLAVPANAASARPVAVASYSTATGHSAYTDNP